MESGTDIHGSLRMNINNSGNAKSFHLAPPVVQNVHLFSEISNIYSIDLLIFIYLFIYNFWEVKF